MPPPEFEIFVIFPNFIRSQVLSRSETREATRLLPSLHTRYQVSFYLWQIGPVLRHWKSPKGDIQKVRLLRIPEFQPPPPLNALVPFRAPPPFPQGTFVLGRTHPLPLNFYTFEIQRKEINNEYQYRWLNSTCLLRSHSRISIKQKPLVHYKSAHFMEMSALQRFLLKIRSLQK